MHLTKYYVSSSVGIKLVISMRVCNLPNCVVEIQQLKRITTFVLCTQSPLNLHQFCLTRFQIEGWLELIETTSVVFCINLIVPGFVVHLVNREFWKITIRNLIIKSHVNKLFYQKITLFMILLLFRTILLP